MAMTGVFTWSRPVTPMSLSPGHTPKMVPTVKLVSTMDEPSSGSNATLNPSPARLQTEMISKIK